MDEPRYVAISGDLMRKIAAGRWVVGGLLPTEPELVAEYGVSRETLRRALQRLEVAGLISWHPGTGTRVERATPVAAFTTQWGSAGHLTQYGEAAVRSLVSVEPVTVDAALSAVTGPAEGARQVCITSTRRDPGSPDEVVSWAQVYLGRTPRPRRADEPARRRRIGELCDPARYLGRAATMARGVARTPRSASRNQRGTSSTAVSRRVRRGR
ncbi:GntR family transcriptional regulator [Streptomyces sp. NPDC021212]|uniref:GntR family transcriptional regulator n=1 Tax=Streptomyces sp. NPDC021212 TaxID=3365118 RepID=UPI00379ADA8B